MKAQRATLLAAGLFLFAGAWPAHGALVASQPQTYVFVVGSATANPYPARAALTTEHVDIGVPYASGGWDFHWHDEDNDAEYAPDGAYGRVPDAALITRPASSAWDFIGVGAGQQFYLLPQTQNPAVMFLGMATEEDDPSLKLPWDPMDARGFGLLAQTRVNLLAVTGFAGAPAPGTFSVWQSDGFGTTIAMSSLDGVSAADALFVVSGGHAHFNYGFSAPGIYEMTIQATTAIVPEPGSLAAIGAAPLFLRRRRR